ncbi:MAG: CDP-glycerol glycerophosphotransferase family protein [Candidatus Hodarchaeota archaeon]
MNEELIAVCPHYIGSLKYYDKLFLPLLKENIEMIYLFRNNNEMEEYCKVNNRKYHIINQKSTWEPLYRYRIKKEVREFIKKWKPKLVLQTNDMHVYNDIIVKVAKRFKILTLVLPWATTTPEEYNFKLRQIKEYKYLSKLSKTQIIKMNFYNNIFKIINYPIFIIMGVYSNHKLSLGQGDSDLVGVINKYSKNLLIKQGVNEKKIKILGLLHFDDTLNAKNQSIANLRKKFKLKESEVSIVYFSQPFYKKDLSFLTLEAQLNFLENLIAIISEFYKEKRKNYKLFIKLHPAEELNDYERFSNMNDIQIIKDADNIELILASDFCISFMSTVILSVIALEKPILSLNILGLEAIEIGAKVAGVKECINTWDELKINLDKLEDCEYSTLDNVDYDMLILDGKCYYRTINLIKNMVRITKLRINS